MRTTENLGMIYTSFDFHHTTSLNFHPLTNTSENDNITFELNVPGSHIYIFPDEHSRFHRECTTAQEWTPRFFRHCNLTIVDQLDTTPSPKYGVFGFARINNFSVDIFSRCAGSRWVPMS